MQLDKKEAVSVVPVLKSIPIFQQGCGHVVNRMYTIRPREGERLDLLHIPVTYEEHYEFCRNT